MLVRGYMGTYIKLGIILMDTLIGEHTDDSFSSHPLTSSSIPYKVQKIEISKNTQKEDWVSPHIGLSNHVTFYYNCCISLLHKFLAINPNGRIPALTDTFTDGKQINLFESGSIMQYLVDRYDTEHKISFPRGSREWYEMNNWLFFQNAGVGPMQGQASKYCILRVMRGYEERMYEVEAEKGTVLTSYVVFEMNKVHELTFLSKTISRATRPNTSSMASTDIKPRHAVFTL